MKIGKNQHAAGNEGENKKGSLPSHPENKPNNLHPRSYAAHLGSAAAESKTMQAGPGRHGAYPKGRTYLIERKEP